MSVQSTDPFHTWLDHHEIRGLVNRAIQMRPGERIVLLKGLVARLFEEIGPAALEEARAHPGAPNAQKRAPGEPLGGPTPTGNLHFAEHRDALRAGGRAAERQRQAWPYGCDRAPP